MDAPELKRKVLDLLHQQPFRDPRTIFVTDAVAPCLRKVYYSRVFGMMKNLSMIRGLRVHEELLAKLAHELDCSYEEPVEKTVDGIKILGRIDVLCDDSVIELKTSRYPDLREEWILQVNAYMGLTGRETAYVVVLYGEPDLRVYVHKLEYDPEKFTAFLDRVRTLSESLRTDNPPPAQRSKLCNYCEFKPLCKNEKELLRFLGERLENR